MSRARIRAVRSGRMCHLSLLRNTTQGIRFLVNPTREEVAAPRFSTRYGPPGAPRCWLNADAASDVTH